MAFWMLVVVSVFLLKKINCAKQLNKKEETFTMVT